MTHLLSQLNLFRHATAWKRAYQRVLRPYLNGDILEVGGGIGATTPYLWHEGVHSYTVLEPDPELSGVLRDELRRELPQATIDTRVAVITDLPPEPAYDAISYIDVLEHIEHDRKELEEAARRLRPGGTLVVLSPAFECLRSPFDDAIGHWRRYTRETLEAVFPEGMEVVLSRYMDCLGAALSFGNRLVTRESQPTLKQIRFWNRCILPVSNVLDPLFSTMWGRSVVVVGKKPA